MRAIETAATLATPLVAGRHEDGTYYAIDTTSDGVDRVYISRNRSLVRRPSSTCTRPDSPASGGILCRVPDELLLKVEFADGGGARMGVVREDTFPPDFVIGERGDLVEIVAVSAVEAMRAVERREIFVDYMTTILDGRYLVVLRPEWPSLVAKELRLFFGPIDRVIERKVLAFERARNGDTTTIRFEVDGRAATAFFPSDSRTREAPHLALDDVQHPFDFVRSGAVDEIQGLAFFCR